MLTGHLHGDVSLPKINMSKMEPTTFPPESSPTINLVRLETVFPRIPCLYGFPRQESENTTSELRHGSTR